MFSLKELFVSIYTKVTDILSNNQISLVPLWNGTQYLLDLKAPDQPPDRQTIKTIWYLYNLQFDIEQTIMRYYMSLNRIFFTYFLVMKSSMIYKWLVNGYRYIRKLWTDRMNDSFHNYTVILLSNVKNKYKYDIVTDHIHQEPDFSNVNEMQQKIISHYDGWYHFKKLDENIKDINILIHYKEKVFVNNCKGMYKFTHLNRPLSKVKFLTIQYMHEKMPVSVDLDLDSQYYVSGNELFTPSFIYRLLLEKLSHFHFDLNYTLVLIDNNINILNLRSDQYIELNDNNYIVQNIKE